MDTCWRADNSANGPGIGTDTFSCQTDGLKGHMDALSTSNGAETVEISHGDSTGTYLGAGRTKHGVDATDGIASHTDASIGFRHTKCCKQHKNAYKCTRKHKNTAKRAKAAKLLASIE